MAVMVELGPKVSGRVGPREPVDSSLPSTGARVLALAVIVVSGICGGLIGWSVTNIQVDGDATLWAGLGGLLGAVFAAGGVGVVAVLVLRAMTEWETAPPTVDPPSVRRGRRS